MKPLLIIMLIIGLVFTLIFSSPLKNDFIFNGITYDHIKKMSGGEITNHFYTPNGEELNTSQDFIQILEVSDKIIKSDWSNRFKPLYTQYNLKPMPDKEFVLTGQGNKAGILFNSYASIITIEGKEHMVFYIKTIDAADSQESESEKIDILYELNGIRFN